MAAKTKQLDILPPPPPFPGMEEFEDTDDETDQLQEEVPVAPHKKPLFARIGLSRSPEEKAQAQEEHDKRERLLQEHREQVKKARVEREQRILQERKNKQQEKELEKLRAQEEAEHKKREEAEAKAAELAAAQEQREEKRLEHDLASEKLRLKELEKQREEQEQLEKQHQAELEKERKLREEEEAAYAKELAKKAKELEREHQRESRIEAKLARKSGGFLGLFSKKNDSISKAPTPVENLPDVPTPPQAPTELSSGQDKEEPQVADDKILPEPPVPQETEAIEDEKPHVEIDAPAATKKDEHAHDGDSHLSIKAPVPSVAEQDEHVDLHPHHKIRIKKHHRKDKVKHFFKKTGWDQKDEHEEIKKAHTDLKELQQAVKEARAADYQEVEHLFDPKKEPIQKSTEAIKELVEEPVDHTVYIPPKVAPEPETPKKEKKTIAQRFGLLSRKITPPRPMADHVEDTESQQREEDLRVARQEITDAIEKMVTYKKSRSLFRANRRKPEPRIVETPHVMPKVIDKHEAVYKIEEELHRARMDLLKADFNRAKERYVAMMKLYNELDAQQKERVFQDLNDFYYERQRAAQFLKA